MRNVGVIFTEDEGSTTVETAIALSALIVVFSLMVAGIMTLAAYLSAIDIAGAAARAYAIGTDYQPPRGTITVTEHAGLATASAAVPAPLGTMTAQAIFPMEQ
ncbi:hypothetical protein CMUST_14640 [Corynebacterium mustelae]|uniref:TadE-like protein n=1 Tax=Corynebacterium mustelae TaxID=571915 RepID=A0A0G3H1E9_9CORY|nr:hypothetical protein [Corynebacterium mustelae]AKK07221.1 hypothetical protein CMUST_14640 [Corynebacterium mustelae]